MRKSLNPRNQKELEKINYIAKVAAHLFNEKGYLETSMDDVSRETQLSKGAIYYYFSSKHEILYWISTNYMDLLLNDLEEDLEKIKDPFAKIQRIVTRHIEIYTQHPYEAKTTLHEAHLLPSTLFKRYVQKEKKYYRIVAEVLSEVLGNSLRKAQLRVITFTLFGMCNWIYHWYRPKRGISPQELAAIIAEIFCQGIKGYSVKLKEKI